jgi:hypothetical protein
MAERMTEWKGGQLVALKVAASTKIEAGKMVGVNSAGYAVEAADASGIKVLGVADETADNSSGSNGAITVRILTGKIFKMDNSSTNAVDVADAGTLVFVEDDETVADAAGTNGVVAGRCIEVASDGVWVQIPASPQVAAQAASTAEDVAGVVTSLNALITKLKAAGIMASA